ncbi:MAG: hypothetical protein A2Y77_09375 [Planctomycetes bacterium RBG_13_62_9]|nr:MAG: hypothetical protein A2Y77_09375 [Planctomycetes bacterium RBG_13_62_9]
MGSLAYECPADLDERARHRVELTRAFYCGKYQITQGQWEQVTGRNPSYFTDAGKDAPVEGVNWHNCQRFVEQLRQIERVAEGTYHLLTEAEWEYACRAGTKTPFCYGKELDSTMANFDGLEPWGRVRKLRKGEFRRTTTSVGSFRPNAWGLYDMHGNVLEWCLDHGEYTKDAAVDPVGERPGPNCSAVLRGGCHRDSGWTCRSAHRQLESPRCRDLFHDPSLPVLRGHFGLRIMRIAPSRA